MTLEDQLNSLDLHFRDGGDLHAAQLLEMIALTAKTLKTVAEGVAGVANRVAKLETAYAQLMYYVETKR